MIDARRFLAYLAARLRRAAADRFYGRIVITLQGGSIVHVEISEMLKSVPEDLSAPGDGR